MTKDKYEHLKPQVRHPHALGKYVDLRVIDGHSVATATTRIANLWDPAIAAWCRNACGDGRE